MNDLITNGTEIKQRIISEISKAAQCVYVAVAWFTDRDIANAIINAKDRNVTIDIILSSNANNEEVIRMLKAAGISVHAFDTGDARGLMHHKFCLFDNRISINGSFNFSYNASRNNVENIVVSDDTALYKQFYEEFEQLRFNIDNSIPVSTTKQVTENRFEPVQSVNQVDAFAKQLHNLIYSAAQIDTDEYQKQGFETSKDSFGNVDIFRVEYGNIKEVIKAFATDDGLISKKNILVSNVTNAHETMKASIETEKAERIEIQRRNNELEKRHISEKISLIKLEKAVLESGNDNTGEKGLLQINKEIEKNKAERKTLEQSFVVEKFGTFGTLLTSFFLLIFVCYLSVFFASALYKMLFEGDIIKAAREAGLNPSLPKLVDANALITVFRQEGVLFGFIAMIFFMFPVLLSNIKLLGSERKAINNLLFWVGLLIFDVVVAAMIAINTDEIKSLLVGKESELQAWEVVKKGEFWMIFMFGMVPLIITHYLIENVSGAYKRSRREIVDAEKDKKAQVLESEILELSSIKEGLVKKIGIKEEELIEKRNDLVRLESFMNNELERLENKYADLTRQLSSIYNDVISKITSGRIFTDVIFDTVISAYKSGFVEFLPSYYAPNEVTIRVKEIEQVIANK